MAGTADPHRIKVTLRIFHFRCRDDLNNAAGWNVYVCAVGAHGHLLGKQNAKEKEAVVSVILDTSITNRLINKNISQQNPHRRAPVLLISFYHWIRYNLPAVPSV